VERPMTDARKSVEMGRSGNAHLNRPRPDLGQPLR